MHAATRGKPHVSTDSSIHTETALPERGIDEHHPWLATSRWGKAWRVGLCVLAVWSMWLGIFGVILGEERGPLSTPSLGYAALLLLFPAAFCAALAAVFQRWLTRYVPFTQSILFGALAYAGGLVLAAVLGLIYSGGAPWCEPSTECIPLVTEMLAVGFVLLPAILLGGIGYGLALSTVTARGERVTRWLIAATGFVLVVSTIAFLTQ